MDYKGSRGRLVHSQAFFSGTASSLLPGAVIGSALALMIGGPGVLFWIWISSFFYHATSICFIHTCDTF
ncbi:Phosphatidylserine decarboxylase [Leptospira interrogans serovar Canicola]|nr:Phosphatidylserine decarboxylase [Leptospira interrogans serovar Canicola]